MKSRFLLLIMLWIGLSGCAGRYADQIYPGVSIAGVDVGELTPAEAAARLEDALPPPTSRWLTFQAADQVWRLSWADVGQRYDLAASVAAAYQVGRGADDWTPAQLRAEGHDVAAIIHPADPNRIRDYLAQVAAVVYIAPTDATLRIDNGQVVATPGQPGRQLDMDASVARVTRALQEGERAVDGVLAEVPPAILSPEPAESQARALLAQPFTLAVHTPLIGTPPAGYYAELTAEPARVAQWLDIRPGRDRIALSARDTAIEAWLAEVEPELAETLAFRLPETLVEVLTALYAGEHRAQARIRHLEHTYYVRPGDNLYDIAFAHGFPQWQLERANPDIEPGLLNVGQALTIPSLDVLFPHPLVPDKRIEIDLPTQTMRAYEGDELVFDLRVSSGISTSPTIAGQFQVLFKEEQAYARRWALDMPYFMGIYAEGENYYNGIHELPITSWGTRLSPGVLGWPVSYGCIIVNQGPAAELFAWAPVGTLVRIRGVAPGTPPWQQTLADIAPPVDGP